MCSKPDGERAYCKQSDIAWILQQTKQCDQRCGSFSFGSSPTTSRSVTPKQTRLHTIPQIPLSILALIPTPAATHAPSNASANATLAANPVQWRGSTYVGVVGLTSFLRNLTVGSMRAVSSGPARCRPPTIYGVRSDIASVKLEHWREGERTA